MLHITETNSLINPSVALINEKIMANSFGTVHSIPDDREDLQRPSN